ncbi:hypothetical protein [Mastigocladopsis repens]|nr:hypothetical protein [Mastigocladopsis repens]
MSLIDGLLLTVVNTLACLAFPWLLSVILASKNKRTVSAQATLSSN